MDYVTIERLNEKPVIVSFIDYVRAFKTNDLRLFGMTMEDMVAMRGMYLLLGGTLPITQDEIKRVQDRAYSAIINDSCRLEA